MYVSSVVQLLGGCAVSGTQWVATLQIQRRKPGLAKRRNIEDALPPVVHQIAELVVIKNLDVDQGLDHEMHIRVHTPMTKDADIGLAVNHRTVQGESAVTAGQEIEESRGKSTDQGYQDLDPDTAKDLAAVVVNDPVGEDPEASHMTETEEKADIRAKQEGMREARKRNPRFPNLGTWLTSKLD